MPDKRLFEIEINLRYVAYAVYWGIVALIFFTVFK